VTSPQHRPAFDAATPTSAAAGCPAQATTSTLAGPGRATSRTPRQRALAIAATLALGWLAARLCVALHTPLPWMIGPLLISSLLGIAGLPLAASTRLRNGGQWVIGMALGLYFTPAVTAQMLALAPLMLLGAGWALLIGHGYFRLLRAASPQVDVATAYFASVIGGAAEMAVFAEQHGARIDLVTASHSLRVLIVVVSIPFGYQFAGIHGDAPAVFGAVTHVDAAGLTLLLALTGLGCALMKRLRQPNPWVLGALAVAGLLTANGVHLSAMPGWLSAAAQLAIGVSLGSRFTPAFLHTAPRWLAAVALGSLAMIAASGAFAWALARLVGLDAATVFLGHSPGGIAEMCITAKVLGLGVALVTAFHVVRYVVVLMLAGPIYTRWVARAPRLRPCAPSCGP
jgi:membrane AbrB-like protein